MLSGARTNLRVLVKEDFDWLVAELNKPQARGEWSSFSLRSAMALDRELFEQEPGSGGETVIEDKESRRLGLATWQLTDLVSRSAALEISIFDPGDRGKGLGAEIHRLLIDYLFKHRGLHRIEILSAAENIPEQRLLEKLRFTREGVLREARWARGAWHDLSIYSILEHEWLDQNWDQISF